MRGRALPRRIAVFVIAGGFAWWNAGPFAEGAVSGEVRPMALKGLRDTLKTKGPFIVRFEAPARKSFFTEKSYVHYETVASWGGGDDGSTWRVLYHTEGEFTLLCGGTRAAVTHRNIRTRLSPAFRKVLTKGDGDRLTSSEGPLVDVFDDGAERVVLSEYGLEAGRDYHGEFTVESYHLPPDGPGGRPRRRENVVLTVSDRPLPNDIPLTPLYRGWSY